MLIEDSGFGDGELKTEEEAERAGGSADGSSLLTSTFSRK